MQQLDLFTPSSEASRIADLILDKSKPAYIVPTSPVDLLVENVSNHIQIDLTLAEISNNDILAQDLRDCLSVLEDADKRSLDTLTDDVFTCWLDTAPREMLLMKIDEIAYMMPSIGRRVLA